MILLMAMLDVLGVASIMPFIAVLTNPNLIESNILINKLFNYSNLIGVKTNEQFLFTLGLLIFFLLVFSLAFKALLAFLQLRFSSMCQYGLSKRLMEKYLNQPYSWFLSRHSAEIGKTVLSEVGIIVTKGLKPILSIITYGTVAFAILVLLILNEPKFSLIACTSLSLTYFIIYRFTRNFLMRIGHARVKAVQDRFMVVTEAFNAAKELKVGNLEQAFLERFSIPAKNLAKYSAIAGSIGQLPRYALEIIAFGGMLLLILFLMGQNTFNDVLPLIALYVFAGYRLIPALQQIYASITLLRFVSPSLNATHKDYKNLDPSVPKKNYNLIHLNKGIVINDLYYQYPNSLKTTIKDINLNIPANTTVGIVGSTGSGKTTIVDIILGLLTAQKGTVKVDDSIIDENNIASWQQSIGYVPQDIFIADDTLAANIAFGVDKTDINQEHVLVAAKIAKIHDFIDKLPLKYQTTVGERGVRLSGGERQRIGIARALYRDPKILILDEATSALDNLTEKLVMEEVHKTSSNKTIIMIAHRLSTVKKCDIIFYLEKGELKAQGTYDELIKSSEGFKRIQNK
ncbi:ABC transporter ATP-binding protein/permease [Candidatus Pelagibacter sp.]|nr:ABC transporter ATP-binding protein/permease [Candidatus Pelagibacter sp.]